MTTIEKMTLEIDAKGADNFIKTMDNAVESLSFVSQGMKKVLNDAGILNKQLNKSDINRSNTKKKIFDIDNQQKKAELKNNKLLNDSLSKTLKTLIALSGASFTLRGIKNTAEKSASEGVSLSNQARTGNATEIELEAVRQALKLGGQNANTLDNLINKLSSNQSGYLSNGIMEIDIIDMIGQLNSYAGKSVDPYNTAPIETLKEISNSLKSIVDPHLRKKVSQYMGLSDSEYSALSDNDFTSNLAKGGETAIYNASRVKQNKIDNSKIETANKLFDNAMDEAGTKWANTSVKLTGIYTDLAKNSAILAPMVEDALDLVKILVNGVSSGLEVIFGESGIYTNAKKEVHQFLDDTEQKQYKAEKQKKDILKYYNEKIDTIDREKGIIKFKGGGSFDGGTIDWLSYSPYIYKYLESILKNKDSLKNNTSNLMGLEHITGQELSYQSVSSQVTNTSTAYNNAPINNYSIIVQSDATTFSALMSDIQRLKDANGSHTPFGMVNGADYMPYFNNVG